MADNVARAVAARQAAEKAREDRDRAQGALDQIRKRLKAEFGCATLDAAKALFEKLKKEEEEAAEAADAAWAAFEECRKGNTGG